MAMHVSVMGSSLASVLGIRVRDALLKRLGGRLRHGWRR